MSTDTDGIAKMLGFENIEDAARTAKEEVLSRLLERARRDGDAILVYRPPLREDEESLIAPQSLRDSRGATGRAGSR